MISRLHEPDDDQWRIQDFLESATKPKGAGQPILKPNFPKKCMKMKKFGPKGASKILLCSSATATRCAMGPIGPIRFVKHIHRTVSKYDLHIQLPAGNSRLFY